MTRTSRASLALASALTLAALPAAGADRARIVTVNPVTTEIVFALGAGKSLVGVDQTSALPAAHARLARVGYQRALSAEGVLSLRPTLVLGTEDAGPPSTLQSLREAGVRIEVLPSAPTTEAARERILRVGALLGAAPRARQLVRALDADLARASARAGEVREAPRALFLYTRGNTTALVSGEGTPADAMIRLAGGINAVSGFQGYRTLGAEAIAAAAPEVLVLPRSAAQSLGGEEAILALPGVSLTPAGRDRRVVVMEDDLLLHFGPRLGLAVNQLLDGLTRSSALPR